MTKIAWNHEYFTWGGHWSQYARLYDYGTFYMSTSEFDNKTYGHWDTNEPRNDTTYYFRNYRYYSSVIGTASNDLIYGQSSLKQAHGLNKYTVPALEEKLSGGKGNDTIYGRDGTDYLYGNSGNDSLDGEGDDDSLDGGSGNDILRGGEGTDTIKGGSGNDILFSPAGKGTSDELTGGTGADTFFLGDAEVSSPHTPFDWGKFAGNIAEGFVTGAAGGIGSALAGPF